MMNDALVIIDMQMQFYQDNPAVFREKLVPNILRALEYARSEGIPVVHVITRYGSDKSEWPLFTRDRGYVWCMDGTDGTEIIDELKPIEGEHVVIKKRYSGFYNTELSELLDSMSIKRLFLAGYACDVCVRMTAIDAYNRDFDLYLLKGCVSSDHEDTEKSIDYLKWLTRINVIDSLCDAF